MEYTIEGPTPFLDQIEAMDLRHLPSSNPPTETMISRTVGYSLKKSTTVSETSTTKIHAKVSATFGLSEITGMKADFTPELGAEHSHTLRKSVMTSAELTTSITRERKMPFPAGQWTGYYQWAVQFDNGHKLYLAQLPLEAFTSLAQKEAKEKTAQKVMITGKKYKPPVDDTARASVGWSDSGEARAGRACAKASRKVAASAEIGSSGAKAEADYCASVRAGWENTAVQVGASAGPKAAACFKAESVNIGGELASVRAGPVEVRAGLKFGYNIKKGIDFGWWSVRWG